MDDDFLYEPIPGITEEKTKQTLEKFKSIRTSPTSSPKNEGKASLEYDNSLLNSPPRQAREVIILDNTPVKEEDTISSQSTDSFTDIYNAILERHKVKKEKEFRKVSTPDSTTVKHEGSIKQEITLPKIKRPKKEQKIDDDVIDLTGDVIPYPKPSKLEENSNEERPVKKRKIEEQSIFDDPLPPTLTEVASSTSEDSSVAREELRAFAGHDEEYSEPQQNNTEEELMAVREYAKRDFDNMPIMEPSPNLNTNLLYYQKQALKWMVDQEAKHTDFTGGILADEMGLGKTIEMIALILNSPSSTQANRGGTLIICPLSTLFQWCEEIDRKVKANVLDVLVYYGGNRTSEVGKLKAPRVVITTYGVLCSEYTDDKNKQLGTLFSVHWHRVILDEAHTIKNPRSRTAKAAFHLRSNRRWCLTGTPIQNALMDLYSLFHFVRADGFGNSSWFAKLIGAIRRKQTDGYYRLSTIMQEYVLRRTKTQKIRGSSILTLPKTDVNKIKIKMTAAESSFYKVLFEGAQAIFERYRQQNLIQKNYFHIFELLLRLRQASNHGYLVLMCLQPGNNSRTKGFYDIPSRIMKEMVESIDEGDLSLASLVVERLFAQPQSTCPICLDDLEDTRVTKCGHQFCRECIEDWLGSHDTCPCCRTTLSSRELVPKERIDRQRRQQLNQVMNSETDTTSEPKEPSIYDYKTPNDSWVNLKSSKLNALMEELLQTRQKDPKKKTVVFSQFTMFLDMIEITLDAANFKYVRLDGSMERYQRTVSIKQFTEDPDTTVFLISLKAGGTGLNLTAASQVIICDPWWNPAIEQQAIDRVHRFGQTETVRVVHLMVEDGVEETIVQLQEHKKLLAEATLGDISNMNSLDLSDLRLLFKDVRRFERAQSDEDD